MPCRRLAAQFSEDAEGVHESLQWKWLLLISVDWAHSRFPPRGTASQPIKFEPYDPVDDRYLFEPIAKICGHVIPLCCNGAAARLTLAPASRHAVDRFST